LPVLFRQAQYLAGRRYRTWMEKLLPLDRHEACLNAFDKDFANVRFPPIADMPPPTPRQSNSRDLTLCGTGQLVSPRRPPDLPLISTGLRFRWTGPASQSSGAWGDPYKSPIAGAGLVRSLHGSIHALPARESTSFLEVPSNVLNEAQIELYDIGTRHRH
jgi:hypothetical protein